jgi:hypothetical protein
MSPSSRNARKFLFFSFSNTPICYLINTISNFENDSWIIKEQTSKRTSVLQQGRLVQACVVSRYTENVSEVLNYAGPSEAFSSLYSLSRSTKHMSEVLNYAGPSEAFSNLCSLKKYLMFSMASKLPSSLSWHSYQQYNTIMNRALNTHASEARVTVSRSP